MTKAQAIKFCSCPLILKTVSNTFIFYRAYALAHEKPATKKPVKKGPVYKPPVKSEFTDEIRDSRTSLKQSRFFDCSTHDPTLGCCAHCGEWGELKFGYYDESTQKDLYFCKTDDNCRSSRVKAALLTGEAIRQADGVIIWTPGRKVALTK
jgi:hypothetical protein